MGCACGEWVCLECFEAVGRSLGRTEADKAMDIAAKAKDPRKMREEDL